MSGNALRIQRLQVRRTPGITSGGFVLESLAPGVNIVFGPNGSGKTTTADAIEAALWPAHATSPDVSVAARFGLQGADWHVELDGGRLRVQCDGRHAGGPPRLPAAESRHRYRLHLHELLSPEHAGADFARMIMRESTGGYDLRAAADALRLAMPGAQSGQHEGRELVQARARLREARERQRAIAVEAEALRELDVAIAAAQAARVRSVLLDAALEHARAVRAHADARAALDGFDPRCANLTGHEWGQLRELDARAQAAEQAALRAAAEVDAAAAEMRRLLPAGELPAALLPALRAELRIIEDLRRRMSGHEEAVRAADGTRAGICTELRVGGAEERLAAIDLGALEDAAALARDGARLEAEHAALHAERSALEVPAAGDDEEVLRRGMHALEEWLAAPAAAVGVERLRALGIGLACLLLASGLLLSWRVHTGGWALVLLALFAIVYVVRQRAPADPRPALAESYRRLGLAPPPAWTRDDVAAALDALRRRVAEARLAQARAERARSVARRLAELDESRAALEQRRADMAARIGVAPDAAATTLAWLVERIGRWQQARDASVAARAALAAARAEYEARCRDVAGRLAPYGLTAAADEASLVGATDALLTLAEQFAAARQRGALASQAHRAAVETGARAVEDRTALRQRLALDEHEGPLLEAWTSSLDDYRTALADAGRAAERVRSADAALRALPGFDEALLTRPEPVLALERQDAARLAAEYEGLVGRRADLAARVQLAKSGSEVAAALAEERRCLDALAAARDRDAERAVGAALVGQLLAATRDEQRPAVFHRARELFLDVTRDRYRLDLDDGDEPAFFAHDTESGLGHPLHELSSATRVQLLLCVRLAFVETQEDGGPRLPLLLDETLGTSDDARAQAIIDAVLTLAAGGRRQVFYFTAQHDEVAKWLGAIRDRGADGTLVDLAEIRRLARPAAVTAAAAPEPAAPPVPDACTHAEYGALLRVPAIDPEAASIGGTHLWHLTDDPAVLHALLCRRLESWGPLESLLDRQGDGVLGELACEVPRLRAAAAALCEAHRLARVGRGRRVDRRALAASDAVSDTFMDRVHDACEQVGGDAARLLALLDGGIARFQERSRERLRGFLLEHGYLNPEPPLPPGEITVRTLAAVEGERRRGLITQEHVDRLVAAVLPRDVRPAATAAGALPVAHPGLAAAAVALDTNVNERS